MIIGVDLVMWIVVVIGVFGAGILAASTIWRNEESVLEPVPSDAGHVVEYTPAHMRDGYMQGIVSSAKDWWRRGKRDKAIKKGYAEWYLIDDSIPKPRYVKPERKDGSSIPVVDVDGERYLFPRSVMLPNEVTKIPTVFHVKGNEQPVTFDDNPFAVGANVLKDYSDMVVTSNPPGGLLSGLGFGNMDSMDMLRYAVLGLIAYFIFMEFIGGGVF